jgi:CHAT domain-containing protein
METNLLTPGAPRARFSNGTTVQVPGHTAQVAQWTNERAAARSYRLPAEEDTAPYLRAALEELEIYEQETIHVSVRDARFSGSDEIVLRPAPTTDGVQVILYQDESGGLSWHLPDRGVEPSRLRGGGHRFTINGRTRAARRLVHQTNFVPPLRGPITKWARKIFKIIVIPLAKIVGSPIRAIVGKIEARHRPERLRALMPNNYKNSSADLFSDWNSLKSGRALLIIHGVFSNTHGMLSGLAPSHFEHLWQSYQGRVLAYDHFTVTKDPLQNAKDLLRALQQAPVNATFDVLCHSRGGIVARSVIEQLDHTPGMFEKVFFAGTPNAGSRLADSSHLVDMLDVFTNLLTMIPDGPVAFSIEVILAIIKLLAYAGARELPGIAAMSTSGYIPDVLNRGQRGGAYAAAATNYEPDPDHDNAFFNGRFADYIIDSVFDNKANDLVVPTDGVWKKNGHPSFPIQNPLLFDKSDRVWHTEFFRRQETVEAICDHFELPQLSNVPPRERHRLAKRDSITRAPKTARKIRSTFEDVLERTSVPTLRTISPFGGSRTRGSVILARAEAPGGGQLGGYLPRASARPPRGAGGKKKGGGGGGRPRASGRPVSVRRLPKRKSKTPPSDLPAIEVTRQPHIDFHEQVRAGQKLDLIVRLEDLIGADVSPHFKTRFEAGESSVTVSVTLHAPGFDVEPQGEISMVIMRQREAKLERVRFVVTARDPGPQPVHRSLTADFWVKGTCIGSVTHGTVVVPADWTGPAPSDGRSSAKPIEVSNEARLDCDLQLFVQGLNTEGKPPFHLSVRNETRGFEYPLRYMGTIEFPDLAKYLTDYFEEQINNYPSFAPKKQLEKALEAWEAGFVKALDALGKRLWTFLPQAFRDEYFRLYEAEAPVRSVAVHSDEMMFPWELVIPHDVRNGKQVVLRQLGVAHVLGRWKPSLTTRPRPQKYPINTFVVLNPTYSSDPLPWSATEIDELKKLLPKFTVVNADRPAVDKLLRRNDVRLVHFSGHGNYDPTNADLNHLILKDGKRLNAIDFTGSTLAGEGSPIIYLNACSVGQTGPTVGYMGGFAAICLEAGCSGIIAPYWPINDKRAMEFSRDLYQALRDGHSIGEALQELRMAHPTDSTYLAYSYFGDPWARTVFPGLS